MERKYYRSTADINKLIAELIFRNIKKPINEDFINKLIQIIVNKYSLESFMAKKNIDLVSSINLSEIEKQCLQSEYIGYLSEDNYSREYYQYLNLTRLVLKELELINLKKRYIENTLFNRIVGLSFEQKDTLTSEEKTGITKKSGYRNNQFIANQTIYCNLAPEERYAHITSNNYVDAIISLLEQEEIDKINIIEFIDVLVEPYLNVKNAQVKTKQKSPALFYLEQIGCSQKELKHIARNHKDDSIQSKLNMGLEVPDNIISDALKTQNSLKRKLVRK